MSKRPADNVNDTPTKKARINPELEAMKATLNSLLSTANTHHEEARIAAIDTASVLEEEWTDLSMEKDKLQEELSGVTSECETAVSYLETFEKSNTLQMLRKACETKVVENLVDDNEKITETLTKLRNLSGRLTALREKAETELIEKTTQWEVVKSRFDAAEKRVDVITNLN